MREIIKALKEIDFVLFEGDKDQAHKLILVLLRKLKNDRETNRPFEN
jgi:hypothetical protein